MIDTELLPPAAETFVGRTRWCDRYDTHTRDEEPVPIQFVARTEQE